MVVSRPGFDGTVALSHPETPAPQDLRPSSANGTQIEPTGDAVVAKTDDLGPDARVAQEDLPSRDHLNAQCNSALRGHLNQRTARPARVPVS